MLTTNLTLLIGLAEAGVGLLFSAWLPESFGAGGAGLVPVLDDTVGGEVSLRALSPRPGRTDPRVQALLENIKRMIVAFDQGR
jgi:DNA-binding transcriptional LysR family regulator